MSEFQCYKFKTIDRPLTDSERREVDALSSRGEVTSTSATFIYHYSDFRHKPETVLEKYFDAMLYYSNWGTRRLMFRLPAKLVDEKALKPYFYGEEYSCCIEIIRRGEYLLLDIQFNDEEGGGWMEDDDYDLGDLAPLRDDILNGDYGALYLAWVSFAQHEGRYEDEDFEEDDDDDDGTESDKTPPVPPNMKRMSAALKAFTHFFEVDDDLVSAAQALSPDLAADSLDYEKLLAQLPEIERVEWLTRLLKSELRLDVLLRKRLEQFAPKGAAPKPVQVTGAELKTLANQKEQERKVRETAEARERHVQRMKQLAPQEQALWKSVPFNLVRQTGKSYELATDALKELQALAEYQGKAEAFRVRMLELRKEYARRTTLISRWEKAGLFL